MRLTNKSVEFAKKHIDKYFDSDFFPKPFEFKVISSNWDEVKSYLCENEINTFNIECPITYAVPKHSKGFRIAHQLDPLNSLIYTSFAYEISNEIENIRVPVSERIACSYRFNLDDNGNFFSEGSGYEDFFNRSFELSAQYNFVLQTDITDFYNQVYLHRLQNSIEFCNPSLREISHEIEGFLMGINNKVSKGIPVGPAASILMAETLLIDIDQYLLYRGFDYTRYVDDFRIFSNSKFELDMLVHDFTAYLYDNHRLTLEGAKTKIYTTDDFIVTQLKDPERIERNEVQKEIDKLNVKVTNFYWEFDDDEGESVTDEEKIKAQGDAFKKLMEEIINKDYFDLGLSRHILRRSKALRSRAIITQLLTNIDFFAPVIRDVILYLDAVTNKKMIEMNIDTFSSIIENSQAIKFPYFRFWMEHYFASNKEFANYKVVREFIINSNNLRNCALFAETTNSLNWVRQYKNKLFTLGSWEKRAVMHSAKILSSDERKNWMDIVERNSNNFLDKIIVSYIKNI